ncbi:hypothetical protein Tco_0016380 [Tanacetum coccineum]
MQTQMNNLATSNQRLESMLGNFIKMNTASSSGTGSLPSNTVANPKGELKAITTRSGLVLDEPSVPMPPPFINPEEDERVEETFTDPEHVLLHSVSAGWEVLGLRCPSTAPTAKITSSHHDFKGKSIEEQTRIGALCLLHLKGVQNASMHSCEEIREVFLFQGGGFIGRPILEKS